MKCHGISEDIKTTLNISLRLIDVQESCLVTIQAGTVLPRFVSLSYVWGTNQTLLSTTENLQQLHVPGTLSTSPYAEKLAKTIRDAMLFIKRLGVRFLWADMLCIVQDAPLDKVVRLPAMASIYGQSYFTIIAADSENAQHGIEGSNHLSPRKPNAGLIYLNGEVVLRRVPPPERDRPKRWHHRAWPLQERILSRRVVIFLDGLARWQCSSAYYDERPEVAPDQASCVCNDGQMTEDYSFEQRIYPDLMKYCYLVEDYTQRLLSDPNDGLNAFSGILTAMSEFFPNGFYQGLPEFFFDIALLWKASHPAGKEIVMPSRRSKDSSTSKFASWAWAGWEYHTGVEYSSFMDDYQNPMCIRTTPINTWWRSDIDGNLTSIRNGFYIYRDTATLEHSDLWGHWEKIRRSHYSDRYYFRHPDVRDPLGTFEYPLPVTNVPYQVITRPESPILHFTSTSYTLEISNGMITKNRGLPMYHLRTANGDWAGVIDDFQCDLPSGRGSKILCELVAISRGSSRNANPGTSWFLHEALPELVVNELRGLRKYQWYNVLWVKWEDGIAYRQGIGRVWKPIWERLSLKTVDVKLG